MRPVVTAAEWLAARRAAEAAEDLHREISEAFGHREALAKLAGTELDFVERVEADLGFHLLLCRLAGNSMLVDAWRHLEGRIRVAIMSGGPDRAPRMMSEVRHVPIVEAIQNGDLAVGKRVIDQHMAEAADHFADALG